MLDGTKSEKAIVLSSAGTVKDGNLFFPAIEMWVMPSNWGCQNNDGVYYVMAYEKEDIKIVGYPCTMLPDIFAARQSNISAEEMTQKCIRSITPNARAVLELLEALSCSNIDTEIFTKHQQRTNSRGKKKLPIYETRCLVLNSPGNASTKHTGNGGNKNSPRQHLRRGHIRRLETKNIWVNSCVVGSLENGLIDKSYSVKNAAN